MMEVDAPRVGARGKKKQGERRPAALRTSNASNASKKGRGDLDSTDVTSYPRTPFGQGTKPQDPGVPLFYSDDESEEPEDKYEWHHLWARLKKARWTDQRPIAADLESQWYYIRPDRTVSSGVLGTDYFGFKDDVTKWVKEQDNPITSRKGSSITAAFDVEAESMGGVAVPAAKLGSGIGDTSSNGVALLGVAVKSRLSPNLAQAPPRAGGAGVSRSQSLNSKGGKVPKLVTTAPRTLPSGAHGKVAARKEGASSGGVVKKRRPSASSRASATKTVGEMIERARLELSASRYIESPQLNRDAAYTELMQFLTTSVDCCGGGGSYYACGKPGTGKTVTIKRACDAAVRRAETLKDKTKIPSVVYLNMGSLRSAATGGASSRKDQTSFNRTPQQRIFDAIADALGVEKIDDFASAAKIDTQIAARSQSSIEKKLTKKTGASTRKHVILIADEIDLILAGNSSKNVDAIYTLFGWSSNPNMSFTLIGISNAVEVREKNLLPRLGLEGMGDVPTVSVFEPYTANELISIVHNRVGSHFFDPFGLTLMAQRVSATWGDCRLFLDLALECVSAAFYSINELNAPYISERQDQTRNTIVVQKSHVFQTMKNSLNNDHCATIAALPAAAQFVLCVVVGLSGGDKNSRAGLTIMQGDLQNICRRVSTDCGLMETVDSANFNDLLLTLQDNSLIEIDSNNQNELRKKLITLRCATNDVEIAVDSTLGNSFVFARIMRVTREMQLS
jgi:Cdc6-like AAA superfamily ATPase